MRIDAICRPRPPCMVGVVCLCLQKPLIVGASAGVVKFRIECIEVFAVQIFLDDAETFTKSLVMDDLTFPKETDGIADLRVFYETQNVVIRGPGFLLGSHILVNVRDRIAFGLKISGGPRRAGCCLWIECQCVIDIIFVKTVFFDFGRCEVLCQLVDYGTDHFHVSELFCAQRSIGNVPQGEIG